MLSLPPHLATVISRGVQLISHRTFTTYNVTRGAAYGLRLTSVLIPDLLLTSFVTLGQLLNFFGTLVAHLHGK